MSTQKDQVEEDFDVLPVEAYRNELIKAIADNQILVCIGETGSGKTTKIPQFVVDSSELGIRRIAVTQPRRVAAISVAERVAEERRTQVGGEVGYTVRFDDRSSSRTIIKYMTDGVLVRECIRDPLLSKYGLIMLDEAHERSLHTDILFGLVKAACLKRPELKVLVTSATLNTANFAEYFNNSPVLTIPGRVFPVDIYHSKMKQIMTVSGPASNEYIQSAVDITLRIHDSEPSGHILVFMTGQDDIEKACQLINSTPDKYDDLIALPLYSSLPTNMQKKVFAKIDNRDVRYSNRRFSSSLESELRSLRSEYDDKNKNFNNTESNSSTNDRSNQNRKDMPSRFIRKVIFATNIAETSITVPHVRYVVDCGYVKQKAYDPDRHMESLVTVPISQVSAQQRAGRAGRTAPGKCYRLYSSECYDEMLHETIPELLRTNLNNTVLYLKTIEINDVIAFDFLTKPNRNQFIESLLLLHKLKAIDDNGIITRLGRLMSEFPLEPTLSRAIVAASKTRENCVVEVVTIAAMLSVESVYLDFHRVKHLLFEKQTRLTDEEVRVLIESRHGSFRCQYGDHFTLLSIYRQWEQENFDRKFCDDNLLNQRAMKMAKNVRDQILGDCVKSELIDTHEQMRSLRSPAKSSTIQDVSSAFVQGYFMNGLQLCQGGSQSILAMPSASSSSATAAERNRIYYRTMPLDSSELQFVACHPSSVINTCSKPPTIAVFNELVYFGGKPMVKSLIAVDGGELGSLMKSWKMPKDVLKLSNQVSPSSDEQNTDSTIAPGEDSSRLENATVVSESSESRQKIVREREEETKKLNDSAQSAKERYLARKKAKN